MTSRFRATALSVGAAVLAGLALPATGHAAASGGAAPADAPQVQSLTCRTGCAAIDRARGGSVVRVVGERLDAAKQIVFLGRRGRGDDVAGTVVSRSAAAADVQVPAGARTGPVRVITLEGQRSKATRQRLRIVRGTPKRTPRLQARVDVRRVFIGATRKASVSFFLGGEQSSAVVVGVVPAGQDQPVATWTPGVLAPGTVSSVEWDGLAGGAPAPEGLYEFRVAAVSESQNASAAQAAPPSSARSRFRLLSHRFPIDGPHTYGEGAGRFGADRGDSAHQGQDVFAPCGTPLVAAMGGKVKHVAFQERAGHYVVIAADDGFDHAYMHLARPTPLVKGERVATGAPVGLVGDTGRASGCHLHFEMWQAPGWYTGGAPVDPLPYLRAWDG